MIFVRENGRTIPKEDKIFSISNRAKEAIAKYGKDNVYSVNSVEKFVFDDLELSHIKIGAI